MFDLLRHRCQTCFSPLACDGLQSLHQCVRLALHGAYFAVYHIRDNLRISKRAARTRLVPCNVTMSIFSRLTEKRESWSAMAELAALINLIPPSCTDKDMSTVLSRHMKNRMLLSPLEQSWPSPQAASAELCTGTQDASHLQAWSPRASPTRTAGPVYSSNATGPAQVHSIGMAFGFQ